MFLYNKRTKLKCSQTNNKLNRNVQDIQIKKPSEPKN